MTDDIDANFDAEVDRLAALLDAPPAPAKDAVKEEKEPEKTEISEGEIPPSEAGAEQPPTDETQPKTNETEKVEAELPPLEPPASWRSEEKALFENLPREVQEVALRLQQASDSHFTQRSTELAQARRVAEEELAQLKNERVRYTEKLEHIQSMAAQLLPAKFQDIRSDADYIRLKATDPQRASEYEAFQAALRMAQSEYETHQKAKLTEHLNREYQMLVEKYPDFRDAKKAESVLNDVRKAAVELYSFDPREVAVISDHRYVPIIQDAMAWRQHQANLRAAAGKKVAPVTQKVMKPAAGASNPKSLADERAQTIRNRAAKARNEMEKAEILSELLG